MQPVAVDAATGPVRGDGLGLLPAELRIRRVAEAQLEPGAEVVAHRGPHITPARRGDHDVDPVGQALRRENADRLLESFEVVPDAGPAVDDEENVTERVGGRVDEPVAAEPAQLRHRLDPPFGEDPFAPPQ